MTKKFLKFFILLLVVAGISFGISIWWSRRGQNEENLALKRFEGNVEEYYLSGAKTQKLTIEEANFPFFNSATSELFYYYPRTGEIKSINPKGSLRTRPVTTIAPRATGIEWSRDGKELIATYSTGSTYYNLSANTNRKIDTKIHFVSFSPDSDQISYLYFDQKTGEGNISIADSSFQNFKNIFKTRLKNWEIYWRQDKMLSLIASLGAGNRKSLYLLETDGSHFTKLIESQENLQILWSPDGRYLLYSRGLSSPELFILKVTDGSSKKPAVKTLASKCAWDSDSVTIYCAVPESSDDSFVKLNVTENKDPAVLSSVIDANFVNADRLIFAKTIPAVIFKNLKDGRLYMIELGR